jgi:hypothetical protein
LVAVGENVEDELRRTEREAAEKFGVTFEESRTLSTIRSAITATKRRATESVSLDTSLLSKLLAL